MQPNGRTPPIIMPLVLIEKSGQKKLILKFNTVRKCLN